MNRGDSQSNSTDVSPLASSRSLGEPLECYDPLKVDCKSLYLSPEVIEMRKRRPLEPMGYLTVEEDGYWEDPVSIMWREHLSVLGYIEREAWRFPQVLQDFWYFDAKPVDLDPNDIEEMSLGYCDKLGLQLSVMRGVERKYNEHLDIAFRIETREGYAAGPATPIHERCVLRSFEEQCDKVVQDVHEDTKKIVEIGKPPIVLADVGFGIARKLLSDIGVNFDENSDFWESREEWEFYREIWGSRATVFFKMATKLVTYALPYLDGFLPSLLLIACEIVKEAYETERSKLRDRVPRLQIMADMEDSVFGHAMNCVNAAVKSIAKAEEQFLLKGTVGSEEGVKNRLRARMVWWFFLIPLRREWERREEELDGLFSNITATDELVVSEYIGRRIAELIGMFAETRDTLSFFSDMCQPDEDGGVLMSVLQMWCRPKKLILPETIAKVARSIGILCEHNCIYESPENLIQALNMLRDLFSVATMHDINSVNRSPSKSSVMWAVSKFWDVVGEFHLGEIVGSVQTSVELATLYSSMFMTEGAYYNYSFCRSVGGFYKWIPAGIMAKAEVVGIVQHSLDGICVQLCNSTDFKLRWNAAYAVGCCFGNENIFAVLESVVMDTALVPICTTIRRSQNFKERIQALVAMGKLIRGPSLKASLGYVLESVCISLLTLPHDTPSQHNHAKKFKVEAASTFCHLLSILEPVDLMTLQAVLVTNLEHLRSLLKQIDGEIPEGKAEIILKAHDRLKAIIARRTEKYPLLHVELLMNELLSKAVVDRGNYV